jgi:hypothetical protein
MQSYWTFTIFLALCAFVTPALWSIHGQLKRLATAQERIAAAMEQSRHHE